LRRGKKEERELHEQQLPRQLEPPQQQKKTQQ